MEYQDLKVYSGPKEKCDNCEKAFRIGDVITLTHGQNVVFCYSDAQGMCLQEYLMFKMAVPQMLTGEPAIYRQRLPLDSVQAAPTRPTFWQRVGRFFDLGLRK